MEYFFLKAECSNKEWTSGPFPVFFFLYLLLQRVCFIKYEKYTLSCRILIFWMAEVVGWADGHGESSIIRRSENPGYHSEYDTVRMFKSKPVERTSWLLAAWWWSTLLLKCIWNSLYWCCISNTFSEALLYNISGWLLALTQHPYTEPSCGS